MDGDQYRAAGRLAGKAARDAQKKWLPAMRNSGTFVKHVVPAAEKPLHSLWHEFLGFIFLLVAAWGGFRMWKKAAAMSIVEFVMVGIFVVVTAIYGVSSVLKARRISRS